MHGSEHTYTHTVHKHTVVSENEHKLNKARLNPALCQLSASQVTYLEVVNTVG